MIPGVPMSCHSRGRSGTYIYIERETEREGVKECDAWRDRDKWSLCNFSILRDRADVVEADPC